MLGKSYVIEHCVDELNRMQKKEAFEFYISEMLRSMNNSIATNFGGAKFEKSWRELLNYKPETRSAKQIKNHVLDRLKKIEES